MRARRSRADQPEQPAAALPGAQRAGLVRRYFGSIALRKIAEHPMAAQVATAVVATAVVAAAVGLVVGVLLAALLVREVD